MDSTKKKKCIGRVKSASWIVTLESTVFQRHGLKKKCASWEFMSFLKNMFRGGYFRQFGANRLDFQHKWGQITYINLNW